MNIKIEDIAEREEEEEEGNEEDTMKLYVGKTFHNWDYVVNFMKKYAITKGHGVRIGGEGKVDKITQEITNKHTYEIMEEIRFLTIVTKADITIQYQIIREKFKIRIHRPDLYNAISKFYLELTPGEADVKILLKRLYKKKIEDYQWVVSMKLDPITSSLTHFFWMSLE
ncbi:hypothetical protein RIR_jg13878.t1 [Rhizophagus irregularis DAOM 181602=DAOM 197198]|nr:hypothetical protein RIR_jg13878.t1 [Rhizophagus irregularis DAOM 181602=DAOM 197198]